MNLFDDVYIYFMLAPKLNAVKIGASVLPWERLRNIQVGCPEKLKLICTIGKVKRLDEKIIKNLFLEHRIEREWYKYEGGIKEVLENTVKEYKTQGKEVYLEHG